MDDAQENLEVQISEGFEGKLVGGWGANFCTPPMKDFALTINLVGEGVANLAPLP
jgi:hypothetical protein